MTAKRRESTAGYLFALPWILGFFIFLAYPVAASIYYSFCEYSVLKPPIYVGLQNYSDLMHDHKFWITLWNTFYFTIFSVPATTVVTIGLALLLNTKVKGLPVYRTIFFVPSLVPQVALACLWMWILNSDHGILNDLLGHIGLPFASFDGHFPFVHPYIGHLQPGWMSDPNWTKPSLILMSLWTGGNAMVIYLAGLQDVPTELIEACDLDGATPLAKLRFVTLPMISPVILFNVIMAMIGAVQVFVIPYIMFPQGEPIKSAYFFVSYLFDNAIVFHKMGYACAMGWIMFLLIFAMTLVSLKISEKKVYYGGG